MSSSEGIPLHRPEPISSFQRAEGTVVKKTTSLLKVSSDKTTAFASTVPLHQESEESKSWLSHHIDLLAGKSNKYAALFDIQDSAQGAMRNTASLVQHFVGASAVIGKVVAADGAACSFAYMIVRGLTFRTAMQTLPIAWKYGDMYDKFDSLVTLLRTFGGTLASALGVGKNIGAVLAWTALAIPATIVSVIFFAIWAIKGIVGIGRLLASYIKMESAFAAGGYTDKDKLNQMVNYLAEVDQVLEDESDELRGPEYMAIKTELAQLHEGDTARKETLQKQLEELKAANPERESFLQERTLTRLTQKYGMKGIKRIKEYGAIRNQITQFNTLRAQLEASLDKGEITEQFYGDKLRELTTKESRYVERAMQWYSEVKSGMAQGMVLQGVLFAGCLFGIAGAILALMTAHIWMPIGLALSIIASVLWIVYDAGGWQIQTEVTKSQKQWVREILSQYAEQDNFINEHNADLFARYFLDSDDHHILARKKKAEKVEFTKHHLKKLILHDPRVDDLINSDFVAYLKQHRSKALSEDDHEYLRSHIDQVILSLGKDETRKPQVKHQMQTIKFIEELLKGDQQKRLGELQENRNYMLMQLTKEFRAFTDDYARQMIAGEPPASVA